METPQFQIPQLCPKMATWAPFSHCHGRKENTAVLLSCFRGTVKTKALASDLFWLLDMEMQEALDLCGELLLDTEIMEALDLCGELLLDTEMMEALDLCCELPLDTEMMEALDLCCELLLDTEMMEALNLFCELLHTEMMEEALDLFGFLDREMERHLSSRLQAVEREAQLSCLFWHQGKEKQTCHHLLLYCFQGKETWARHRRRCGHEADKDCEAADDLVDY